MCVIFTYKMTSALAKVNDPHKGRHLTLKQDPVTLSAMPPRSESPHGLTALTPASVLKSTLCQSSRNLEDT